MLRVVLIALIAATLALFLWMGNIGGGVAVDELDGSPADPPSKQRESLGTASSEVLPRVEVEHERHARPEGSNAVFSGWVVDSVGNPGVDLLVRVWRLEDVVSGNRPSEHGCATQTDGAFRVDLPDAWRDVVLGVSVSSEDRFVSALLVARSGAGQTLVVSSPHAPDSRLDGVVRLRGPLEEGLWLMPVERARALVTGGEFSDSLIKLGAVGLNLKRPAWEDGAFGLAVLSRKRAPVAYRRFANAPSLNGWLDEQPEIEVSNCRVRVPAIDGAMVTSVEFGLQDVPQFGVVWWGESGVENGHFHLCAESGTKFVFVGNVEGQGVAVGSCRVQSGGVNSVAWAMKLPGAYDVDVSIDLSAAPGDRSLDIQAVPVLEGGARVQSRRAWRTARCLVRKESGQLTSVRVSGMAAGRYELQVLDGRRIVASVEAMIPGQVPVLALPGQAAVVFAVPHDGLPQDHLEVCYVSEGSSGPPAVVRLPTGIGGFEGFGLQRVPPGDYRFCLRHRDRYAEGRFRVDSGATVVNVPVDEEPIQWIEGRVEGGEVEQSCVVSVVAAHVAAPWLSVHAAGGGVFRLGVPRRYLDRGLSARWGDQYVQLREAVPGRWERQE